MRRRKQDERTAVVWFLRTLAARYNAAAASTPEVREAQNIDEMNAAFEADPRATVLLEIADSVADGKHVEFLQSHIRAHSIARAAALDARIVAEYVVLTCPPPA